MAITYSEDGKKKERKGTKIAMDIFPKKLPKDIDAFNSKTSGNGFVNDATELPLNIIKFLRGNKKKKDALQQAASIRPYQQVGGSLFKALTIQQLGGYR